MVWGRAAPLVWEGGLNTDPGASPLAPPSAPAGPPPAQPRPPLHVCHVSLLLMQLHSQGGYFLPAEPVSLRVNVLTASLGSL